MSQCAGICCAVFTLSKTYDHLVSEVDTIRDGPYIIDMLIPLPPEQAQARARQFGLGWLFPDESQPLYTCRHWDEATRLCTAYEQRPGMCRKYPYAGDGPCRHGCGLEIPTETAPPAESAERS